MEEQSSADEAMALLYRRTTPIKISMTVIVYIWPVSRLEEAIEFIYNEGI